MINNNIDYKNEIRIGLTNLCNFNCTFCHNEGMYKKEETCITIKPNDYKFISETSQHYLGINKFVLSGGEPLLRKDIIEISKSIKNNKNEVVLITNGFLLKNYLELGDILDEIHVSLGTLNPKLQDKRTGTNDTLDNVLESIREISKRKCKLKINVVMLNNENKTLDNLRSMLVFSKEIDCQLHLIEVYPEETSYYMSFSQIEKRLSSLGYRRKSRSGLKVRFQKESYPDVFITFIPCAFASSPLMKNIKKFCKENQSIYIDNNLNIQPCFEKKEDKISILDSVKDKNVEILINKLNFARTKIGEGCPLIK